MDKHAIINIGSASLKYALTSGGSISAAGRFEKGNRPVFTFSIGVHETTKDVSSEDYDRGFQIFLNLCTEKGAIRSFEEIKSVAVRIVAPGTFFTEHRPIDESYLSKLRAAAPRSPLHVVPTIAEIESITSLLPGSKLYGISDSAFFRRVPAVAKLYAISPALASAHDIYRFGYHGLSAQSIVGALEKTAIPERAVICHLGSGNSVIAVRNGEAIDMSMGFTPLEGIPMGSRSGNIDPNAIFYLMKALQKNAEEMQSFLYKECGLLALSGVSPFIKDLLDLEQSGSTPAHDALELYVYCIKKYIGASVAALGGIDALIFTGAVGERSADIRRRVCSGLCGLNIGLDSNKNLNPDFFGVDVRSRESEAHMYVMRSKEMEEMEKERNIMYSASAHA